jgi:segregation and condensation protein A
MSEEEKSSLDQLPQDASLADVARAASEKASDETPAENAEADKEPQDTAANHPRTALTPFKLALDDFEGPLDLLIFLVRKNDLDIFQVSIASIADQFSAIIFAMPRPDLNVAGEYLEVAGTLVRMKARALLPSEIDEEEEEEEDPAVEIERLREYRMFKQAAGILRGKESDMADLYAREKPPKEVSQMREEEEIEFIEVDIYALYSAFKKVMADITTNIEDKVIEDEEFTVDEKIEELRSLMMRNPELLLADYLGKLRSKLEAIVTFLAILEMMRMKLIRARQAVSGGDIFLLRLERLMRWEGGREIDFEYD